MGIDVKSIDTPDEKPTFEHGEVRVVKLGDVSIGRAVFEPGWRWSTDVKPAAGTDSCQIPHTGYIVSGRMRVRMDDGEERDLGPGDAHVVPPGHDAWVVGDEPCVAIDFTGSGAFAHGLDGAGARVRIARCPCGVEFRLDAGGDVAHLVAAVQEHAKGSHDHEVTREHVMEEITTG